MHQKVAGEIADESGGKFVFELVNPDAPGSAVTRETLLSSYGLRPIAVSLFSPESYYLHLVLQTRSSNYPPHSFNLTASKFVDKHHVQV